jgi:RNA polymerase sigma-70 factor, ECF subfamily
MAGPVISAGSALVEALPHMLPRLWAFALRLSDDTHDAEDLVQLSCLRALERTHHLQPDTAPLSWMFSILHTMWLNELRARRVRQRSRVEWDDELVDSVADETASDPLAEAMHAQIIREVQQLPDAQRAVMLLVAVEGLSYQEAADALGVPIGTVMSRLSRARQTIGARFGTPRRAKMSRTT